MASAIEDQATLVWLATPDGNAALHALTRLQKAFELERQANSDEASEAAQQAALAADAALGEATGIAALRRRRMLPADNAANAEFRDKFRQRMRRLMLNDTPAVRHGLRTALGRFVYDYAETLGGDIGNHLAGHLLQSDSGRDGVMATESKQGVDPKTGAAWMLQKKIVADAGYMVGATIPGERVPPAIWTLAAKVHNDLAERIRAGGEKVTTVGAETVRGWCVREGELRELFDENRKQGRKDHAAGTVKKARLLGRGRRK